MYLWSSERLQEWIKGGGKVWDTLLAQYLLDGQRKVPRDLDTLALRYGGTLKDDRVKVMYDAGLTSKEIPKDIIVEYAEHDVHNTQRVALCQMKEVRHINAYPLIKVYMQHLLAVTEMEANGLHVDTEALQAHRARYENEIVTTTHDLKEMIGDDNFNPMSNQQVSKIIFNGVIKSVDEKTLIKLPSTPFISGILKLRELNKILKTYIYTEVYYKRDNKAKGIKAGESRATTGLKPLIMPDGCIHSEYSMAFTATGRLSSGNPNVQNLPPAILDIFTSRFEDGYIAEFDFHQLEIVVQAYLSQSENMIQDIEDGVDFHCKRLSYAEQRPYKEVFDLCQTDKKWALKRKAAKQISFQKAYGAHPESIAKSTGLKQSTVELVFQKEDEDYPEIRQFYELVLEEVQNTRVVTSNPLKIKVKATGEFIEMPGESEAYGTYQSLTGKLYSFYEKAVLTSRGVFRYFPMPDIQNYPVQGLAADIVAMMAGEVFKFGINHRDKFLIINEVHDSIIIDVKKDHLEFAKKEICSILNNTSTYFKQHFGLDFNVPLSVDVKVGRTWKDCKEG